MAKLKLLLTGGAGFIGSNIGLELAGHPDIDKIVILDDLSTGSEVNILSIRNHPKLTFYKGDIRDFKTCIEASKGVDVICHQAALCSVPRSINDPISTHNVNSSGTLNIFYAAKQNTIKKVVFASSSSVYGDNAVLPKKEENKGNALSPYAVSKQTNELYADVFSKSYDFNYIGLRYFNVFGPNQNPNGPYASVIPLFILNAMKNQPSVIHGDGSQSRDFTYVANVVQANSNAIFSENKSSWNNVYNIAYGSRATVLEMYNKVLRIANKKIEPVFAPSRTGDIPHSFADISKAQKLLSYKPVISFDEGLERTYKWFVEKKL